VERDRKRPAAPQELAVPSCNNSDQFLTPFEFEDWHLVWGFVKERYHTLWPNSLYGLLWCVFRGFYHVSMSFILVLMIDNVWKTEEEVAQTTAPDEGGAGDVLSQVGLGSKRASCGVRPHRMGRSVTWVLACR
jgi:hypothetical protein